MRSLLLAYWYSVLVRGRLSYVVFAFMLFEIMLMLYSRGLVVHRDEVESHFLNNM